MGRVGDDSVHSKNSTLLPLDCTIWHLCFFSLLERAVSTLQSIDRYMYMNCLELIQCVASVRVSYCWISPDLLIARRTVFIRRFKPNTMQPFVSILFFHVEFLIDHLVKLPWHPHTSSTIYILMDHFTLRTWAFSSFFSARDKSHTCEWAGRELPWQSNSLGYHIWDSSGVVNEITPESHIAAPCNLGNLYFR